MSKRRVRKPKLPPVPVEASIERLSPEGRGVAHINGKVTFIDYALPGERVMCEYTHTSSKYDEGRAIEVLQSAANRVQARCEHFGVCGGCSLQHLHVDAQIAAKQETLLNHLQHLAKAQPENILPPLRNDEWGYRYKARLGVRYVAKKGKVLVGFREKATSWLADLHGCKVLHPAVGERFGALSELIMGMDARETIPQIEVAISDDVTALVFRHLQPMSLADSQRLTNFAQQNNLQIYLQPGGTETIHALWPEVPSPLRYTLPSHQVQIEFAPSDFTQVNPAINRKMVDRTLELLELKPDEHALDLFCGLGNFTLPMARHCEHVTGVEGAIELVQKARDNARMNNIENVEFHAADLSSDLQGYPWLNQTYDKILLDPPRTGAMEMLKYLGKLKARKIVYVSCNPATLARDAEVLIHEFGYRLSAAGVMDMFPHTAHVESIAVFDKK